MTDTLRIICLALAVGVLAGVDAATDAPHRQLQALRTNQLLIVGQAGQKRAILGVDAQGRIGLEFDDENGRQHVRLGHLDTDDDAGRVPKFWGLQVGNGESLTGAGVYIDRTATGALWVVPAIGDFGSRSHFEWPDRYTPPSVQRHVAKLLPRIPE